MKKLLAFVLTMGLLLGCTTTAFATQSDIMIGTDLTAYVYSNYEITIPATVDLKQTQNQFDITVTEANIDPEKKLYIYFERSEMKRTFDEITADLELYVNDVLCNTKDSIIGEFTEPGSVTITAKMADNAPAGTYTGRVTFYVTID